MAIIQHLVTIEAPVQDVWEAVASTKGVSRWWTPHVSGDASPGGVFRAEFRSGGYGEFAVREHVPQRLARWECVNNASLEWVGTEVRFDLEPSGDITTLRFRHEGWAEASDFFSSCNYFWGRFMTSIKALAETGRGRPR